MAQRPRLPARERQRAIEVRQVRTNRAVAADEPGVWVVAVRRMIEHGDAVDLLFLSGRTREGTAAVGPFGALTETVGRACNSGGDRHRAAVPLIDDVGDAHQRQRVLVRFAERDGLVVRREVCFDIPQTQAPAEPEDAEAADIIEQHAAIGRNPLRALLEAAPDGAGRHPVERSVHDAAVAGADVRAVTDVRACRFEIEVNAVEVAAGVPE